MTPPFDFIWSDQHFGHGNVCRGTSKWTRGFRDFDHPDDMATTLINNFNAVAWSHSRTLWLGDCFMRMGPARFADVLAQCKGEHYLVRGNHDKAHHVMVGTCGFKWSVDELWWEYRGTPVLFSHFSWKRGRNEFDQRTKFKYPQRDQCPKDTVLVHGHTHAKVKYGPKSVHVGVDAWDFKPIRWEDLEAGIEIAAGLTEEV